MDNNIVDVKSIHEFKAKIDQAGIPPSVPHLCVECRHHSRAVPCAATVLPLCGVCTCAGTGGDLVCLQPASLRLCTLFNMSTATIRILARLLQVLLVVHKASGEVVEGVVVEGVVAGEVLEEKVKKEVNVTLPPPPEDYHYHQHVDGDVVVREYLLLEVHPRSALMCPKGLALAKVRMLLKVGEDVVASHPEARLKAPFDYQLVEANDGLPNSDAHGFTRCPTLQRCLGYQACLFTFGIEFCHLDPLPGTRKNLLVTVTCMRDAALAKAMREVLYEASSVAEIERRAGLVLHLTYTSQLEEGVKDLNSTVIEEREVVEDEVFDATCQQLQDATKIGYHGHCHSEPPASEAVSEALWSLLGRVPSHQCRKELQQVYCSFLYHKQGLCFPPFLVAPGQVSQVDPEALRLAHPSLPKVGLRPPPTHLRKNPPGPLLPACLGFVVLVHKDPPAVMQLLSLIYRPHHFYVLHVDRRATEVRRALTDLLLHLMPGASNIRILPAARSFVASWGSYNIVRAEMESYEELLRMGLWDFAVNLSGADMPLRDVDDLAATLAPYRGVSFVPLFGQRNKDLKSKDQGLAWDVWHGCEGYVYNVTKAGGQPTSQDLLIFTGCVHGRRVWWSQWKVLTRELADYAVTPARRSRVTNRWQFHLQTSIVPDESYFPTLTLNSPFANATQFLGFHWLKKFEGRNTINLCRHMEDTDFCGQGPGPIIENDLRGIFDNSHRYFFARKFPTSSPTHTSRVQVHEHVRTGYYQKLRSYLPHALLRQLLKAAHTRLVEKNLVAPSTRPGNLLSLRALPVLHLTNPCCSLAFSRAFKSIQEFRFLLDFTFVDAEGWAAGTARATVLQKPPFDCFPDGHLRAMRVTTWVQDPHASRRSQLSINMPLPFAAPGADAVYLEAWFHVGARSVSPECLATKGVRAPSLGTPMEFADLKVENVTAQPLQMVVQLVDPNGSERRRETWEESRIHSNADGEKVELASFVTLACGLMEPGLWTVRMFQVRPATPAYELKVGVLAASSASQEPEPDLLMGLWRVEDVALLPLPDPYSSFEEWLTCGGGLLTMTLAVVFTYHWVVVPVLLSVRASPRMQRSALLVLGAQMRMGVGGLERMTSWAARKYGRLVVAGGLSTFLVLNLTLHAGAGLHYYCTQECLEAVMTAPIASLDRDVILHIRNYWLDPPAPPGAYKPSFPLEEPPWSTMGNWGEAYKFINKYFKSYERFRTTQRIEM
ncbi:Xylosyltransferase 1 [Chionoecetes opilio]|uniref:protein xylosyltransferase n=1 Tax=Chionoecetes opilio TaxID=41210 RepID=A0A8J4YLE7_CHIOP|nr:Xylosyltransferase 1 [Chionoecetes opilio]